MCSHRLTEVMRPLSDCPHHPVGQEVIKNDRFSLNSAKKKKLNTTREVYVSGLFECVLGFFFGGGFLLAVFKK